VNLEQVLADNLIFVIGLLIALAGFAVGILAFIFAVLRSERGAGQMRGGGVVMIGPIPIIFGTDKESARMLILLTIVLIAIFFLFTLLSILWR
jgi:uncharacterized protein (TIGR00304 family)